MTVDTQSAPQRRAHLGSGLNFIRWVGDLPEKPVHQAAVGAFLGFQPLSDIDAEGVAHHVRGGRAQHLMGSIDGIKSRTDLLPGLLCTQC